MRLGPGFNGFIFRRSRSEAPPHTPNRSSLSRANARHSSFTPQPRQTLFASRLLSPLPGKNSSASTWAHNASSCQWYSSDVEFKPWIVARDPYWAQVNLPDNFTVVICKYSFSNNLI